MGPDPSGADFDAGWKFANRQQIEMVDEHSYKSADWFIENQNRYDSYKRNGTRVYIGEYAAWTKHVSNLFCALAEATYLTGLSDVIRVHELAGGRTARGRRAAVGVCLQRLSGSSAFRDRCADLRQRSGMFGRE